MTTEEIKYSLIGLGVLVVLFLIVRQVRRHKAYKVRKYYKYRSEPIFIRDETPDDRTGEARKRREESLLEKYENKMGPNGERVPVYYYPFRQWGATDERGEHDSWNSYHIAFGKFVEKNRFNFDTTQLKKDPEKFDEKRYHLN